MYGGFLLVRITDEYISQESGDIPKESLHR